jgi:hypothetical protein
MNREKAGVFLPRGNPVRVEKSGWMMIREDSDLTWLF